MIPDLVLRLAQTFLEAITIIMIATTININIKLSIKKLLIYAAIPTALSLVVIYTQLPFHLAFSVALNIGLYLIIKWPPRKMIANYAIDILLAIGVLAVLQLMISGIAILTHIDLLGDENYITVFFLIGFIVIFALLSSVAKVHIFFEKYYMPYRPTILFSIVSLIILITIVLDLMYHLREVFATEGRVQIIALLIVYFVINLLLGFSLQRIKHLRDKSDALSKYGEHLQNVVNEYRTSVHDYKSHMQMIINLSQNQEEDGRKEKLEEYIQELAGEHIRKSDTSIITDDSVLSALLFQKQVYAKQNGIDFNVNIAGSVTAYHISQSELIDILVNLIDNAFEEVEKLGVENRIVQIDFDEHLIIVGNNVSTHTQMNDADKFFMQGYSTKGAGRGYGLSNVVNIAKRNSIEIHNGLAGDFLRIRLKFPDEK